MKKALKMAALKAGALIAFIVIIFVLKALVTKSPSLQMVVDFLISNIFIICMIAIMFIISDIFWELKKPFFALHPVFNAIGAAFAVALIYNIGEVAEQNYENTKLFLGEYELIVTIVVASIVLCMGIPNVYRKWKKS